MKELSPAERLIVAADFKPLPNWTSARNSIRHQVLDLAEKLHGTGVYLKINSALRACGYGLIDEIHNRGLKVFADLKLYDIGETLALDGMLLKEARPELLTVVCSTGTDSMRRLKTELPETEVLGVTVLTSIKDGDDTLFGGSISSRVISYADMVCEASLDGLIASTAEIADLRGPSYARRFNHLSINCPGIRPVWAIIQDDDQNPARIMTPAKAIHAGADRIVVGRPITQAMDARSAVMRTLEEIESALVPA